MASKHPKVTVYIPQKVLLALDKWQQIYGGSRSEAIVTILEDYLEGMHLVQYEEPQESTAPPKPSLSLVIAEINDLKERLSALEELIDAAQEEVPGTVLIESEPSNSDVLDEVPNTAPVKIAEPGEVQGSVPSPAPAELPSAPLTQSALAKRLGCSDKAVEKQRKHGKESFAQWSGDRDPDGIAWTWEGQGGRGQPLRFLAIPSLPGYFE